LRTHIKKYQVGYLKCEDIQESLAGQSLWVVEDKTVLDLVQETTETLINKVQALDTTQHLRNTVILHQVMATRHQYLHTLMEPHMHHLHHLLMDHRGLQCHQHQHQHPQTTLVRLIHHHQVIRVILHLLHHETTRVIVKAQVVLLAILMVIHNNPVPARVGAKALILHHLQMTKREEVITIHIATETSTEKQILVV